MVGRRANERSTRTSQAFMGLILALIWAPILWFIVKLFLAFPKG